MGDTVYISDDVYVSIDEPESIDIGIQENDAVETGIEDTYLVYGNLPRGGDTGDILVKTAPRDYRAEWMTLRQAGLTHIYYDTTANWNAQASMVSEEGAIYIYSDYTVSSAGVIPAVKIGDGSAYLIDLPFTSSDYIDRLYDHITNRQIHILPEEREFWNNKVTSAMDSVDPENLILTKEFIL